VIIPKHVYFMPSKTNLAQKKQSKHAQKKQIERPKKMKTVQNVKLLRHHFLQEYLTISASLSKEQI